MSTAVKDRVPNAPLREKVLEVMECEGVSMSAIAARAGWMSGSGSGRSGDSSYLQRLLGLRQWSSAAGHKHDKYDPRPWMSYDAAVKLCRALNLDPVDLGL